MTKTLRNFECSSKLDFLFHLKILEKKRIIFKCSSKLHFLFHLKILNKREDHAGSYQIDEDLIVSRVIEKLLVTEKRLISRDIVVPEGSDIELVFEDIARKVCNICL